MATTHVCAVAICLQLACLVLLSWWMLSAFGICHVHRYGLIIRLNELLIHP